MMNEICDNIHNWIDSLLGGRASLINSECKKIMIDDWSWPFVIDNNVSDNKENIEYHLLEVLNKELCANVMFEQ